MSLITNCLAQEHSLVFFENKFEQLKSISNKDKFENMIKEINHESLHRNELEMIYMVFLAHLHANELDRLNTKSTELFQQVADKAKGNSNLALQTWLYTQIGFYYYSFNQYTEAFNYFHKSSYSLSQLADEELLDGCEVLKKNAYFFQTITEHDKSIEYLNRALTLTPTYSKEYSSLLNALGINYLNKGDIVLAEKYFLKTKESAITNNDIIRYAKALGDIARVEIIRQNWNTAEKLLLEDIELSLANDDNRNAMYAQLQLGKMYLENGNTQKAYQILLASKQYAKSKNYLKSYEKESTQLLLNIVTNQNRDTEELNLRRELDELKKQTSSEDELTINKVALDYQKKIIISELETQKTKLEKSVFMQKAIFFICFLLMIIIILLFLLYKRRIKLQTIDFDQKVLTFQNDKKKAEAKLTEANNTLDSFHLYLETKNRQIQKLEKEISTIHNENQKDSLEELLNSHLMTDDNWVLFKQAFKKEQPKYYKNLMLRFPNLTESNLRIILLQRMGLNNQETAQIIGITIDAVKKAKLRLRKKYSTKEEMTDFAPFLKEN